MTKTPTERVAEAEKIISILGALPTATDLEFIFDGCIQIARFIADQQEYIKQINELLDSAHQTNQAIGKRLQEQQKRIEELEDNLEESENCIEEVDKIARIIERIIK